MRRSLMLLILGLVSLGAGSTTQPIGLAGMSFQIENVDQSLLLRPRDASNKNGTPLVLYPHEAWKCMTWKLESAGEGYRLMNYFTHKTLQPDVNPSATGETAVIEEPATKSAFEAQQWKFIPLGNDFYRIDNVKTGDSLGANADGNVTAGKWSDAPSQHWKLLPKPEAFTG